MEEKNYISIVEYCNFHSIETSFVQTLEAHGLIQITQRDQVLMLEFEQLPMLEKYIHMHYELEVNVPGIEVISRLLDKITTLQAELSSLKKV